MQITPDDLRRLAPACDAVVWAEALTRAAAEFEINSPSRVAHWLAQLIHESGGLVRLQESLNYSVEGLLATFSRRRISEADCRALGRAPGRPANQEAIANLIYGGDWGRINLGNVQPGDGWRFRGRGPIQTTGRSNYRKTGDALGLDLIANPDALAQPPVGARAAAAFWRDRGLNALADAGKLEEITTRINGGQLGIDERRAVLVKALGVFRPTDRLTA